MNTKKLFAIIAVLISVAIPSFAACRNYDNENCIRRKLECTSQFGGCRWIICEPTEEPVQQCPADTDPEQDSTKAPVNEPTEKPTQEPTKEPTVVPTQAPTKAPAATATIQPTKKPEGGIRNDAYASDVVRQVNEERAKYGLGALTVDSDLTNAACKRAQEITQQFSHTRPDGSSWSTVSKKAYGENIAKGQNSADKVMAAWMSSDGHRANILRESYNTIGVCAYSYNGVIYWVQLFGRN